MNTSHSGVILCTQYSDNGFEDTKGITRNRKSEEIIQWSRDSQLMVHKTRHRQLQIEQHKPY